MIICPNKKNPEVAREFNELVQATSEQAAYHIWSLNNGNAIDRAPNGAPSKLFLTLLEHYNGDRTKAIQAKAKTYSNSFLTWFGDWINDSENASKVVDENGEPSILYILNNVPASKRDDTEKDYALTRQIKGFINSEITLLNSERMSNNKPIINRNSDIAISKQTFSSSNGKYVIVRKLSDNISDLEFNKLYKDLLNKETDFGIQASMRKGDILVMSNKYNISTEDFISTQSHDFDPAQYYKLLIFNEPKESAIAILEQLLSDVETQEEKLAILGLITELNCR